MNLFVNNTCPCSFGRYNLYKTYCTKKIQTIGKYGGNKRERINSQYNRYITKTISTETLESDNFEEQMGGGRSSSKFELELELDQSIGQQNGGDNNEKEKT